MQPLGVGMPWIQTGMLYASWWWGTARAQTGMPCNPWDKCWIGPYVNAFDYLRVGIARVQMWMPLGIMGLKWPYLRVVGMKDPDDNACITWIGGFLGIKVSGRYSNRNAKVTIAKEGKWQHWSSLNRFEYCGSQITWEDKIVNFSLMFWTMYILK